jgi:hypothetical protein
MFIRAAVWLLSVFQRPMCWSLAWYYGEVVEPLRSGSSCEVFRWSRAGSQREEWEPSPLLILSFSSIHEVRAFVLSWVPTVMYCLTTGPKQWSQPIVNWSPNHPFVFISQVFITVLENGLAQFPNTPTQGSTTTPSARHGELRLLSSHSKFSTIWPCWWVMLVLSLDYPPFFFVFKLFSFSLIPNSQHLLIFFFFWL